MQTIAGSGMIITLKLEDIVRLEDMFAKPTGATSTGLVYTIPQWLVNLRTAAERRDALLLSFPV